jgi:hypothetical protein
VAAFQDFDYGKALSHLEAGIHEAEERGAEGLTGSGLSDLYIYRAMVKNAQGNTVAAWDDFLRAVAIEPGRHLDAVRFSPSVVSAFERARATLAEGPHTALEVSTPDDCQLFVDGSQRPAGVASDLPSGVHLVRVECRGYERLALALPVSGETQAFRAQPVRPKQPTRDELLELARRRGFAHLLWVQWHADPAVASSATVELMDVAGKSLGSTSLGVASDASDRSRVRAAADPLLDALTPKTIADTGTPAIVVAKRRWYQSGWFWASVGAVSTAAILLPFALQESDKGGFDLRLGGELPR